MNIFKILAIIVSNKIRVNSLTSTTIDSSFGYLLENNCAISRNRCKIVYSCILDRLMDESIISKVLYRVSKNPRFDVTFNLDVEPYYGSTTSARFVQPRKKAYQKYKAVTQVLGSLNREDREEGLTERATPTKKVTINDKTREKFLFNCMSYHHFIRAYDEDISFVSVRFFVEQVIYDRFKPDIVKLKNYREKCKLELQSILQSCGIKAYIEGDIADYYSNETMLSITDNKSDIGVQIMTTEDLARLQYSRLSSYTSNPFTVDLALDLESDKVVSNDIFTTKRGSIFAIDGPTGRGKTYTMHSMVPSILENGAHISFLDIQGHATIPIIKSIEELESRMQDVKNNFKYTLVDFGDDRLRINTLRLDKIARVIDYELDNLLLTQKLEHKLRADLAKDMYDMAVNSTSIISTLLVYDIKDGGAIGGKNYGIISDIVRSVFQTSGVVPNDLSTFSRTKSLTFTNIIERIKDRIATADKSDSKVYEEILDSFTLNLKSINLLAVEGDIYEPITITNILESHIVSYLFRKNENETFTMVDCIRLEVMKILDSQKFYIRKTLGLYSVQVFEDVQRYLTYKLGDAYPFLDYVFNKSSGSRMSNLITFIIYNYADMDCKEWERVRANITGFFTFPMAPDEVEKYVKSYSQSEEFKNNLLYLSKNSRSLDNFERLFALTCSSDNGRIEKRCMALMPEPIKEIYEKHKARVQK